MPLRTELITSRANPRIKQLRAVTARGRLNEGLAALEGAHLLHEALRSGIRLESVFISERCEVPSGIPRGTDILRVEHDVLASALETESAQGIAALLTPPQSSLETMLKPPALILVAAGLQDPGNLGTLIRSAEAFAATGVLLTPGTVSPWNGKALRASAGSAFRMPLASADASALQALKHAGVRLLAAVKDGGRSPDDLHLDQPVALVIGNEGAGLDDATLALCDARISLPCPGAVESLNAAVAGSLLLYEASRQRRARSTGDRT